MATSAIVIWTKDWSTAPFVDPVECRHPGPAVLTVGLDIVRDRSGGPGRIDTRCIVCMLCGTDSAGQLEPDEALRAAWKEHAWHRSTRDRLLALADYRNGGESA